MAEPGTIEEPKIDPPPPTVPLDEPPPVDPPLVDDEGDEGKPGGADPQAVRARREYQARKAQEAKNAQLQRELDELKGTVKTLKELKAEQPKERIYTLAEVNAAVDAGKITRVVADQYIDEYIWPAKIEAYRQKERDQEAKLKPEEKAFKECEDYSKLQPWLNNPADPRFATVAVEFNRLTSDYGMPDNWVTKALAVRNTLGPIEKIREKAALRANTRDATNFHSELPGGGNGGDPKKADLSKAPAELVAFWDSHGVTAKEREVEFKYWREEQAKRKR